MHNLEELIAEWRKTMMDAARASTETIDELENHLRENVDQLVRSGTTELEAFRRAVTQLGGALALASEFQKLKQTTWLPVKVITGIGLMLTVSMVILLIMRFGAGGTTLLLGSHVLLVTLGYSTTFLIGALGICFVGQRSFSDFSPVRTRSLTDVTFTLGCIAVGLTAVGVVLAMAWAKAEWGRYWDWDAKEIGAFAVIVWQLTFLLAHRFAHVTARGILVMSVLGNIVIGLGWFGANLFAGLHHYGTWNYSLLLLAAIAANFAVFLLGFAPAGWLRLRKVSPQ